MNLTGFYPLPAEFDLADLGRSAWQWLGPVVLVAGSVLAGTLLQWTFLAAGRAVVRRTVTGWDDKLMALLPGPMRVLFTLLFMRLFLPLLSLPADEEELIAPFIRVLLVAAGTWLVLRSITLLADLAYSVLSRDVQDSTLLRSIRTRVVIPAAILRFIAVLVGVALICLQFEVVRNVGVSLMASAGLAGIVLGLAAQRTIANLLAGLQLAFSQPIKIGDAIVVEGEFGWVEEIGLTHVVVKVWDERRLILPVSHFLEKPFQNWTRESSDLLGTVFLYADYTVPVEAVRAELQKILEATDLWDRRVQVLQVTNLTEKAVELRALVSARDGGALFGLRCLVREKLLAWLQTQGRAHLPVHRVEMGAPKDNLTG